MDSPLPRSRLQEYLVSLPRQELMDAFERLSREKEDLAAQLEQQPTPGPDQPNVQANVLLARLISEMDETLQPDAYALALELADVLS